MVTLTGIAGGYLASGHEAVCGPDALSFHRRLRYALWDGFALQCSPVNLTAISGEVLMFIGHHAVAFAAKKVSPGVGLGALFLATMWLDLVWPVLLLLGVEHVEIAPGDTAFTPLRFVSYPWSHSLLLVIAWSALVGVAYGALKKDRAAGLVIGAVVLSHWLLDLIVHRPDLPLYPDTAKVGLGLWNSVPATVVVELAIFAVGVALYARATTALNRSGQWGFYSLVAILLAIYAANLLGPPPENARDIAIVGFAQWLLVLWAWWVDRNRQAGSASPTVIADAFAARS